MGHVSRLPGGGGPLHRASNCAPCLVLQSNFRRIRSGSLPGVPVGRVPSQEIIRLSQTLVCVAEGVALLGCRILIRSDAWGISDVLLTNTALFENEAPIALSYLHVQFLTHHTLMQLTEIHPEERRRLRVAAIKIAICRGMIKRLISPLTSAEKFQERVKREQIHKHSEHSV